MYVRTSPAMLIPMLLIWAALAYATGRMAHNKGYSYPAFAALGFILPVIGLVIAAVMPEKHESSTSSADELAKFKALLDDGAITQDEYDRKKREILG